MNGEKNFQRVLRSLLLSIPTMLVISLHSAQAHADTETYVVRGSVVDSITIFNQTIITTPDLSSYIGTSFELSYAVDFDPLATPTGIGGYSVTEFSFSVGPFQGSRTSPLNPVIINNDNSDGNDVYGLVSSGLNTTTFISSVAGYTFATPSDFWAFILIDTSQSVFTDARYPISLNLADFNQKLFHIKLQMGGVVSSITATIESISTGVEILDGDADGIADFIDNCPVIANSSQSDIDLDGAGDLCDICPSDDSNLCNADGSAAEEASVEDGGAVETPDGNLQIAIDPGDLAEDTTISVTETVFNDPEVDLSIGGNAGVGQSVAFYDLEPDGLIFDSPVTLTIEADVTSLNENQRGNLDLYRLEDTDDDGTPDTFVSLGASCMVVEDPIGTFTAFCTAEVNHFSTFAIVVPLDSDGDGVPDDFMGFIDECPAENASGFDVDENGCIDNFVGLADLVGTLVDEEVISSQMQTSLLAKVANADASSELEHRCTAVYQLEAFINQVNAQTGKKISPEAAALVTDYARSVISFFAVRVSC